MISKNIENKKSLSEIKMSNEAIFRERLVPTLDEVNDFVTHYLSPSRFTYFL